MRRSVLFNRVFGVVILAIMITALFTTLIFNYMCTSVFTHIKENELIPRARALAAVIEDYGQHLMPEWDSQVLSAILNANDEGEMLLGAYSVITDKEGNVILSSGALRQDVLDSIGEAVAEVVQRGELRTKQIPPLRHTSMVTVGVPILGEGEVLGAVLLMVPLVEATLAMGSLNSALFMSALLALPVVAVMVYWAVGRVTRPLRQMRDVAVGMAGGNFEARADASQRGEVGQLARSLNYLSRELSRTIAELTLERNRLKQALDGLQEGIIAVDQNGRVTHHNPAVSGMLREPGARSGEQGDKRLQLVADPQVWADFDKVLAGGKEVIRPLPLGDRVIRIRISPLVGGDGKLAGAVGLFTDVTESERLERTRRDYVANVSHEMRTPLTAMRALLEPLNEGMVRSDETRDRYYAIMLRETLHLSRLIDDLMELSRLQSGQLSVQLQPLSPCEVTQDLSEKYLTVAREKGLDFLLEVPGDCPRVLTNPDRLEQVLVILLDNAMKYTPEGGRVTLSARWDHREVIMTVKDSGIGIDPEDQPYVFDRFYKADKAHTSQGSGLGLSIAREILQILGERIWLDSEPGVGSAFSFSLKREDPAAPGNRSSRP